MNRIKAAASALLSVALLLALILVSETATAQVFDDVALLQETINADFFGVDARAMGMGNTGIVSARDGSGLLYNPANLARVRRIEFRGGLSHLKSSNDTEILDGGSTLTDGRDISKTRINALSLLVPVPTYRGSLVFGFGVHRVNSFDREFGVTIPEPDFPQFETSRGRELETGGLWKWSAGGAVDISPRLAAGGSLHLLTGEDHYNWNRIYANSNADQTITLDQGIIVDYIGVGATVGLNWTISPVVTAGLMMESPTYLQAQENYEQVIDTAFSFYEWVESSYSEYSIRQPMMFGLGLSGTFDRFLIAGDLRYRDWSQLDFNYEDDFLPSNREDRFVEDNLKDVFGVNLGAEYVFPNEGVTVRAGYFLDPLPIDDRYVESQRQYLTFGAGFLIDRVMTIDMSYVHGGYELRDMDPGTYFANYKTRRVFVTFAYRV